MMSLLRLALLAGSLAAAGCMTSTRPLYPYERHELSHVHPTIDDESELVRYFTQQARPRLGTPQTRRLEDSLHEMLEDTFSAALRERVRFAPIHYESPGYTLQVARRGELEIISARILSDEDLSLQECEALEMLTDYLGPAIAHVHPSSEHVRELALLLERRDRAPQNGREGAQHAVDAYLARHFQDQEPRYAGYMMTMGGFALDFLVHHHVRIDPDQTSLHGWVDLLSHEMGHTLIFLGAGLSYKVQLLAAYLNWSGNDDLVTIHETACNVIADRITTAFFSRHVDRSSGVYHAFAQRGDVNRRHEQTMCAIISEYDAIPEHERIARRDGIFAAYRARLADAGFSPRIMNEAYLALQNRYAGGDHVREHLDDIADAVGVRDLVRIVPYLHTQDDLRIVHSRVQRGIRGRNIIRPIEHAHDLVDLGGQDDMPF